MWLPKNGVGGDQKSLDDGRPLIFVSLCTIYLCNFTWFFLKWANLQIAKKKQEHQTSWRESGMIRNWLVLENFKYINIDVKFISTNLKNKKLHISVMSTMCFLNGMGWAVFRTDPILYIAQSLCDNYKMV